MKKHILFVEDDERFRKVLEREIAGFGYEVSGMPDGETAVKAAGETRFDVALFDLRLPGISGIELLESIHELDPGLPVVFLTGHGSLPDAVEAMRAGAYDFLIKPTPLDELELALQRALEHGRLRRQNRNLRTLADREASWEILGESQAVLELRRSIQRIAESEANVLVLGENGTGKELVARAIHRASPRRDSPFVVVNCGAIPNELFESELFGHARGAFTGAERKRQGLVELAEGGTLFLDEIGELPLAVQPALLRMLQFGEFRPVGSERNQTADARVVAATNRDLESGIEKGEFREDLYHRIATLEVVVPPLRERPGDVKLLALEFLSRHNREAPESAAKELSPEALDRLAEQAWTGNVRELENVVFRLVTLVDGAVIEADDVDRNVRSPAKRPRPELSTLDLQTIERSAVVQALRLHQGHRERAAAELGVATKTLYNKIRQHCILPAEWGGE